MIIVIGLQQEPVKVIFVLLQCHLLWNLGHQIHVDNICLLELAV